jgi:SurA N-terminal domain
MGFLRTRQGQRAGLAGIVLLVLGITGCAHAEPGVAAYVGDDRITQRQVDDAVDAISTTLQEGQAVSTQAVLNAMIHGAMSEQIAERQGIAITDSDRVEVLKNSNLAPLLEVSAARPILDDVADQQIVVQNLGERYFAEISTINVTLNPRFGVLDPNQKTIITGQSSSLAEPAAASPTP